VSSDTAERACIAAHLELSRMGDLILFDRGYHVLREVTIMSCIRALQERCAQNIEACRPDRRFMRRVSNLYQNLFFTACKACRLWVCILLIQPIAD
jgi:hypothetical protein